MMQRIKIICCFTLIAFLCLIAPASASGYASMAPGETPPPPDGPPDSPKILPAAAENVIPMPAPVVDETETSHGDEGKIVVYDLETGEEQFFSIPEVLDLPGFDSNAAQLPLAIDNPLDNVLAPADFGTLTQIANPDVWPWRAHVKLEIHFPNFAAGNFFGCSGVLIDPLFILTAGHCIYQHAIDGNNACTGGATGCWADEIRVYPAFDNGDLPYGAAMGSSMFSWGGWTTDHNWEHDMAYVRLNRHVGALTGSYPIGYNSDDSFYENNTFHNPGYPGAPYNGETMMYWLGTYDNVTANTVFIETPSIPGQSGSCAYYKNGDSRICYAVQSHNTGGSDVDAGQTRMVATKFNSIINRIATDTPDTVDLVALDVNVSPSAIPEGGSITSMNYLVHNYSEASYNGSINVDFYMSTNDNISPSDILLGTRTVSLNLGPKSSTRVNVTSPPTIPYPTTGITRAIGIILNIGDANDWNDDSDAWDAAEIDIINCNKPSTPGLVAPSNWAYTQDRTPFFDWSATTYADNYQIMVDDALDWASPIINTHVSGSSYTPGSNLADDTYYWSVRGHDITSGCNIYGDWSGVNALVVDATAPLNPTMWSSTHNSYGWSNDNTITANWSGASDATSGVNGYSLYWSHGASDSPDAILDTSSLSTTSGPLADGAWYLHLRTVDNAGNWSSAKHLGPFYIDTVSPSAWLNNLQPTQGSTTIHLIWNGSDGGSGPDTYSVQYKVGSGSWTNWLNNTASNSANFGPSSPLTVISGQTYYFRVAGRDLAGNLGAYSAAVWTQIVSLSETIYLPMVVR